MLHQTIDKLNACLGALVHQSIFTDLLLVWSLYFTGLYLRAWC